MTTKTEFLRSAFDLGLYDDLSCQDNLCVHIRQNNTLDVLLLEDVHPVAFKLFKDQGYNVTFHPSAMDEGELCEKINNVDILGLRSKTIVTEKILANAPRLKAIGAFCIGTNHIDLKACEARAIPVFNAPYSSTHSVVELVVAEMILLLRNISCKNAKLHAGVWDKSSTNSNEIRGKKLGLVGYGNISKQLSIIAESLGMQVYYFDLEDKPQHGKAHKCNTLHDLLRLVDVVSLHLDGREANRNIISAAEFEIMKQDVVFLNLARGQLVDIDAFMSFYQKGKFRGAAFDVYPDEPKSNLEPFESPLRGLPNVILTPHIGGSTAEAQLHIGEYVSNQILTYVHSRDHLGSVNFLDN